MKKLQFIIIIVALTFQCKAQEPKLSFGPREVYTYLHYDLEDETFKLESMSMKKLNDYIDSVLTSVKSPIIIPNTKDIDTQPCFIFDPPSFESGIGLFDDNEMVLIYEGEEVMIITEDSLIITFKNNRIVIKDDSLCYVINEIIETFDINTLNDE